MTPTDKLRALLDEMDVEWQDFDGEPTWMDSDGRMHYARYEFTFNGPTDELTVYHLTPEQAIAATVGNKPKDNPRNYNPDGTPKIPNMNVGADPDWVDWVASLEHKEPLDLKEVVEQFMFEVICFGGEMGPNDCGGEYCPDEGMVYTNDFIDGWVRRIAATVGVGTCQIEKRHGDWYCTGCGEMVGTCDTASELCIDGNAIELWRHCPKCGRKVTE